MMEAHINAGKPFAFREKVFEREVADRRTQNKAYKETVAYFASHKGEKNSFHNSRCVLPISVGQVYHEADKLAATIKLINENFKTCTIVLCDSLQRYTFQIVEMMNSELALLKAMEKGIDWLGRNEGIYRLLDIPYEIDRWHHWLEHPLYNEQRERIEELYRSNRLFYQAAHDAASSFVWRYKTKTGIHQFDYNRALLLSLEYVKEECSVLPLWMKEGYDYEVYPGKRLVPTRIIHELYVKPINANVLRFLRLGFRKSYQQVI